MDQTAFVDQTSELPGHPGIAQAIPARVPVIATTIVPAEPFAWQSGNRLLILDVDESGWMFAELEFVPAACRYVEIRRATYDWPREAVGALLSRALASGDSALIDTVEQLDLYCHRNFNFTIVNC